MMNFKEQIQLHCRHIPIDQIRVVQFDQIDTARIDQGVLFIFATWSPSSAASFKLLCEALARSPEATFPVYLIDTDAIDREAFMLRFGKTLNGNGETIWIRNGKVLHVDPGYTEKESQTLQDKKVIQRRIASLVSPEESTGVE